MRTSTARRLNAVAQNQRRTRDEAIMNQVEQEGIILNSAWSMIDGMVNWAMFVKHDRVHPTNMMFETSSHAQLFNILLADFLSELKAFKGESIPLGLRAAPSNARPTDLTFLFYLRQVCADPRLGSDTSELSTCVETFADWLEGEMLAEGVNLSDIGVIADIRVPRYRYLKICGDIAKHNLARLAGNVTHVRKLLETCGHPVNEQDGYLTIPNFFEWFHCNIFIYHSSLIAEALNNLRWAIFNYLQPEFRRAWYPKQCGIPDDPSYGYNYPKCCDDPIARAMYWELMNRVRARPWMHRFVVRESFKEHY